MTECCGWVDENSQRHACPFGCTTATQCVRCENSERFARMRKRRRQRKLEQDVTEGIEQKRAKLPDDPCEGFR